MNFEIVGTIFGIANVWLASRQNVWCWPVGLFYILASFVVLWGAHLYAQIGLNTIYLGLTVFGWYKWAQGSQVEKPKLSVTQAKRIEIVLLIAGIVVVGFGVGELMARTTQNSTPYMDGVVAITSCSAMWLATRKKLENWYFWLALNAMAILMYARQGLYFYSGLYAIFLGLALYGLYSWKRDINNEIQI